MDELSAFINRLASYYNEEQLSCEQARDIVRSINEFLYTNYSGIGTTNMLGQDWAYFSDFHRYWETHHKEILDCKIVEEKCTLVADALHKVYELTLGKAFCEVWNTCGLGKDEICRVRLLTANQDFRGSRDFSKLAEIYKNDPGIFDINSIYEYPEDFVKSIKVAKLSQNDKRISYAKNIAKFLIDNNCSHSPSDLLNVYNNDLYELRKAIISHNSAGYGNKKTDMMLRDMVVLGVWDKGENFDKIDVASDVNTIKVALRTGIIKTAIPLVSSFLDIFCYQYSHIEEMNAEAWRRVWQIWCEKYPNDNIASPCILDYFIYNVVGKQFCKESLYTFVCDKEGHQFKWHSGLNKTCQLCLANKHERIRAHKISKVMPCTDKENSHIAISNTAFAQSLPIDKSIGECPFIDICDKSRYLEPPTSISILGETGWITAYANKDNGGGGLMA